MPVFVPLLIIVAIAVVAVLVFGCSASLIGYGLLKTTAKFGSSSAPARTPPPVASSGWTFQYSTGMPAQMTKASDGTYFFDFPSQDGVHYVVESAPSLQMGQVVKLDFNVSGSGTVVPVQGTPPAKVSLYMQRRGDNLSGAGQYQQYRYFHSAVPVVNGDGTLSCTLTPDQWTDVFGKPGTEFQTAFQECVANASVIGFVFGDPGAGATGHGAYSNGGNRFTLKSFTIT